MERGINVVALVKDSERYVFLYDKESTSALLQTLGRFAGDAELSFSWYDAAVLSQRVRRMEVTLLQRMSHRREEAWTAHGSSFVGPKHLTVRFLLL